MRKEISILISAVFIVALISSTAVQSVRVSGAQNQDFLYTVSVTPNFARVQQGEFGTYDVKVLRGPDGIPFSVDLSLSGDSTIPRAAVTFNPPVLNIEQGQTHANSTLKINTHGLDTGSFRFRVEAAAHTPAGPDQAVSNPATLIVTPRSNSIAASESLSSAPSDVSPAQTGENNRALPEATPTPTPAPTSAQPNHAPIAEAGQDQTVNEGERGTLDGSASIDPDKDSLSFSWEQLVPRQPSIKLITSEASGKASFIAPDVDRDTVFRFNLIVQDGNGGQAADLVNVLVKNVALAEAPDTAEPQGGQQEPGTKETTTGSDSTAPSGPTSGESPAASTDNHSPTAEAMQTILVNDGNPLSFSLKGNDPDNDDSISFVIVTNPLRGTLAGFDKATGSVTYVPASGFTGQDSLSFKVVDSSGADSNVGLVVLKASSKVGNTSPSSSPPSQANENATSSGNKSSSVPSSNQPSIEGTLLTRDNKSSATKARDNQTGSENQTLASFAASALSVGEQYYFHLNWGQLGSQDGQFTNPHDIAIDKDGNVFVLDSGNNRVQKFDKSGNPISTSFPTTFSSPQGIAVDNGPGAGNGDVYVVDTGNNIVKRFSNAGVLITSWVGPSGSGPFNTPIDAAIDSSHNVYISDANNHRIVKTDNNGAFISKFGATGNAAGKVQGPHAMAVDSKDFIYVVDSSSNKRVVKYTKDGVWSGTNIVSCGPGSSFNQPHGIAIDSADKVFVTDRAANNVCKFNDQGGFIASFGNPLPDTATNFNSPDGIATSTDAVLQVYVVDAGNNRVEVFSNVPPPSITINLDNPSPKWGTVVTATIDVTSAQQTDKISIKWGDATPDTVITPISVDAQGSAQVTTTHVYAATAILNNPNKVSGKLLTSQGTEKAKTSLPDKEVTLQKHETELTLEMRASGGTPETAVCANCAFYAFGKLVDKDDVDSTPDKDLAGKSITFSGNGVPPTLSSAQTEGLTFSAPAGQSLTVTSGSIRLPVGSHISLPASTGAILAKFVGASSGTTVGVALTKSDNTITTKSPSVGSLLSLDTLDGLISYKDIAITNVGGSSSSSEYAELEFIFARGSSVLQIDPSDKYQVDFTKNAAAEGSYSTLVIRPELYFSTGATQVQNSGGLKITASFDGTNDVAYLGATSPELSYTVDDSEFGVGEGIPTGNVAGDLTWTLLQVGTGASNDVCTQAGVRDFDTDQDGICDKWESKTGGNGNGDDANGKPLNRFVVCPSKAASSVPTGIDTDCSDSAGNAINPTQPAGTLGKFELCHTDMFPGIWPNAAPNGRVCPTVGHKDIYVEIDYLSTHVPSDAAIKSVIKAFGNAPFTGQTADSFGRTDGITLHVIKDESLGASSGWPTGQTFSSNPPTFLWRDPPSGAPANTVDSFLEIKNAKFGTNAERTAFGATTSTSPWNTWGKTLKHYVYHYGLWINFYGGVGATCPSGGLSSGLAETGGNDFAVSLGCGFASFGTTTSDAQQAGTFMHELGHNLNLGHGGPYSNLGVVPAENFRNSIDYNMNCKPNYLSVMSYSRQMPNKGYDTDGVASTTNEVANWEAGYNYQAAGVQTALDYARAVAPTPVAPTVVGKLAESGINEATGLPGSNGRTYNFVYKRGDGAVVMSTTKANINFDGDANLNEVIGSATTPYDINDLTGANVGGCGPSLPGANAALGQPTAGNTMRSYNEWSDLKLVFLDDTGGDSQDGAGGQRPYREMAPPFLNAIKEHAPDNNIQFIPPPSTDGSSVSNAGSSVPLKFRLTDSDGNFVRNAAITFLAKKGTNPAVDPFASGSFVYDLPTDKYQATLNIPKAVKGVISIYYIQNYGAANEILLQGPEAKAAGAPYTYTMTSK